MRTAILRLQGLCLCRNSKSNIVTFSHLKWLRTCILSLSTRPTDTILLQQCPTINAQSNRAGEAQRNYSTSPKIVVSSGICHQHHLKCGGETHQSLLEFVRSFSHFKAHSTENTELLSSAQNTSLLEGQEEESEEEFSVASTLPHANEMESLSDIEGEWKTLPEMSCSVYNLSPYVQKSETLQNLVRIGVDLSKVEKFKGIANMLLMSDFDRDILPYLHHLARVGVAPDKLGYILSVYPMILNDSMDQLEQRVGYLLSKDFTMSDVASLYARAPVMIRMSPLQLDRKLGFLQQVFDLTDSEVRQVALIFPKILPWRKEFVEGMRFHLNEFMGFTNEDMKVMLLKEPKLFTANKYKVLKTFDYIHNTMLIPHSLLVHSPKTLRYRVHIVKGRHLFLVHLGRAQYDPYKENYVSMKRLSEGSDVQFCIEVAKSTIDEFYSFLKTL